MEKEQKTIEEKILEILKEELEYNDQENQYSQWILGISIGKSNTKDIYTARVVVKTSESIYVDGMDIIFKVVDEKVQIDPNYYENTPECQGGTIKDSIRWLRENGKIYYLQLENPHLKIFDRNSYYKRDGNNGK